MLETSVRLLRLLSLLQSRRDWSGAELSQRLAVTGRTIRNDVERLRLLGYRVDSTTGPAGGYRLAPGNRLPPLLLDDDEAVAVAVGLRAAASGSITGIEETSLRALTKLEQTLPARLRGRVDALRASTVSAAASGPTVAAEVLTTLATACHDHQLLRFDYRGHDGTASFRRTEPHRIVYTGRRWYLLAWDLDRSDWRTFRADRIAPHRPVGPTFAPRQPPADAADHVLRGVGAAAWPYPARIRLHVGAAAIADRVPPTAGTVTAIDADTCELLTGGPSLAELAGFLGTLDVEFTVLEPRALTEKLTELAQRHLRAAARGSGHEEAGRPTP